MRKIFTACVLSLLFIVVYSLTWKLLPKAADQPMQIKTVDGPGIKIVSAQVNQLPDLMFETVSELQNADSTRSIVTYRLKWEIVDVKGKKTELFRTTEIFLPSAPEFFPGTNQTDRQEAGYSVANPTPFKSVTVSVDYVLFKDGSAVGPDSGGLGEAFFHAQQAVRGVRWSLGYIYRTKGLDALLDNLKVAEHQE